MADNWHYAENGQKIGPLSEASFRELLMQGKITRKSLVWTSGMKEWQPLEKTPQALQLLPTEKPTANMPDENPPQAAAQEDSLTSRLKHIVLTFIVPPVAVSAIYLAAIYQKIPQVTFAILIFGGLAYLIHSSIKKSRQNKISSPLQEKGEESTFHPALYILLSFLILFFTFIAIMHPEFYMVPITYTAFAFALYTIDKRRRHSHKVSSPPAKAGFPIFKTSSMDTISDEFLDRILFILLFSITFALVIAWIYLLPAYLTYPIILIIKSPRNLPYYVPPIFIYTITPAIFYLMDRTTKNSNKVPWLFNKTVNICFKTSIVVSFFFYPFIVDSTVMHLYYKYVKKPTIHIEDIMIPPTPPAQEEL